MSKTSGTPAFLAPEVCSGAEFKGPPVDLWAIGVTLYIMVYGRLPFMAPGVMKLYATIQSHEPEFPDTTPRGKAVPRDLVLVMRGLLDKNAETRATIETLRGNAWLTSNGTEPLPDAFYDLLIITDEDVDNAITPTLSLSTLASVALKLKSRARHARQRVASGEGLPAPAKRAVVEEEPAPPEPAAPKRPPFLSRGGKSAGGPPRPFLSR